MTQTATKAKQKNKISSTTLPFLCLIITLFMLLFGEEIKKGVNYGLGLSFNTIIPTLFPFFVLSDLWSAVMQTRKDGAIGRLFKRLFHIDGRAAEVFILGTVCGFPLGVKNAVKQYEEGVITKDELGHLCGFVNNPSAAFVISGVGAGIYGSAKIGIILYSAVTLSAIITGILFRSIGPEINNRIDNPRQSFNLVDSIKSAGTSSIMVSSYIIFFSGAISVLQKLIGSSTVIALVSSFLEIANASSIIANQANTLGAFSVSLSAFALGFSGFSVHLQAFAFMPKDVSKTKYLLMKLVQGIICATIIFLLFKQKSCLFKTAFYTITRRV